MFPQIIYQLIYQKQINYVLRNVNYFLQNLLPDKIKIPPSGTLNLKTDSGLIKIATNQTSYLTQILFWKGYKQFEYSDIFEGLSKKATCFLDIGSNIGYYSLLAAKANPTIKIFAFEPALGPKYFLNKNIILNNFNSSITPINLALSDSSGTIDFYEVKSIKYKYLKYDLAGEGNAGTKTTSRNFIKNTVKATTLTNFTKNYNLDKIDLIKMDTEGTEISILKASKETIVKHQPIVICETLYNTIEAELDAFFTAIDYDFYNHTVKGLKKVNTIKRTYDDGVRNCFFVPKSKTGLIEAYKTKD
ncbi:hypothetical protein PK35_14065 [Tamlana nanhaiensis]|uniref:Methyltransferase FkbM domain-containing protein n=1 Tax=Neotamlana nanhaiensis TaxID=1382798 RepID=A0A0D7VXF5_9FLAO|nr:FkbM family methyltransferase [Tamlana nanhaiensis]KJD31531.1 hypothetical protein PK35_14065 [Tamlana nanhaiensis]